MITQEELIKIAKFENNGRSFSFELYSEIFEKNIRHEIYVPILNWETHEPECNIDNILTNQIIQCVNSFHTIDKNVFIVKIKELIFKTFNIYIEATSYMRVPEDLVNELGNTEANRVFFNGQTSESVFQNCDFFSVFFPENEINEVVFWITAKAKWGSNEELIIGYKNGNFSIIR